MCIHFQTSKLRKTKQFDSEHLFGILANYRTTPHAATGVSPAEVLLGRQIRNRITLTGEIQNQISKYEEKKKDTTSHRQEKLFKVGDQVWYQNFGRSSKSKWVKGKLIMKRGHRSWYLVNENEETILRHENQIKKGAVMYIGISE